MASERNVVVLSPHGQCLGRTGCRREIFEKSYFAVERLCQGRDREERRAGSGLDRADGLDVRHDPVLDEGN